MYKKWDNLDFVFYYYFGLKPQITLTDIDLLNTIKNSNETLKYRKAVEKKNFKPCKKTCLQQVSFTLKEN